MKTLKPTKTKPLIKVQIIESESGWGQKVDGVRFFKTDKAADKFINKYNSQNTSTTPPAIYWYAVKIGLVTE